MDCACTCTHSVPRDTRSSRWSLSAAGTRHAGNNTEAHSDYDLPFRPRKRERERVEKKRPFKARRKTKRPRRCLLLLETLLCTIALRTRRDTFSSFCGVRVITILPGQLLCLRERMVNRPKGERKMVEEREVLQNSETNSWEEKSWTNSIVGCTF